MTTDNYFLRSVLETLFIPWCLAGRGVHRNVFVTSLAFRVSHYFGRVACLVEWFGLTIACLQMQPHNHITPPMDICACRLGEEEG